MDPGSHCVAPFYPPNRSGPANSGAKTGASGSRAESPSVSGFLDGDEIEYYNYRTEKRSVPRLPHFTNFTSSLSVSTS
jgi:hypothetical protein